MPQASIETRALTHAYGSLTALRNVELCVPEGCVYALLGPNGAGKTTLLQVLAGVRKATSGTAFVLGTETTRLTPAHRAQVGYVAEGQELPLALTLRELQAWLAPLYATWDAAFAAELQRRFRLPADRALRTFSRGERMKAALLVTLAPRPRVLLMDEPFTGMDALVKDELVSGLLEGAGEGTSVLVSSHDIAELESFADWVGLLDRGDLVLSEPLEEVRERYRRVELTLAEEWRTPAALPSDWLVPEWSGRRGGFIAAHADGPLLEEIRSRVPGVQDVQVRPATLREIFVAVARDRLQQEEVAA